MRHLSSKHFDLIDEVNIKLFLEMDLRGFEKLVKKKQSEWIRTDHR